MSRSGDWRLACAVLVVALSAQVAAGQGEPRWRVMPVRSETEHNLGMIGGENTQHMQGVTRSPSNPDIIYMSHDVGQVWRSSDAGLTWQKSLGRGIHVYAGQSIQVDPVDPDTVLAIVDNSSNYLLNNFQGLYRSTNGGEDWTLVLQRTSANQRFYQHNIDYDLTTVVEHQGAQRWYAAFPNGSLHRSEDGGVTWVQLASLAGHGMLYAIHCHPTDGNTVYVCTENGLLRSNNRGATLSPFGNLPAGQVSSLAINPQSAGEVYAVVRGNGLYRSEDGGETFVRIRAFDALFVFLNKGFPNVIYLVGSGTQSIVSSDSGATWTTVVVTPPPTLDSAWKTLLRGAHTGIVPDPRDAAKAVCFSNAQFWRTENGGRNWVDSSTFFTGYAWGWWADSLAFDVEDPHRWVMFCADVSMIKTTNSGTWFTRHRVPYDWYQQGLIPWIGTYSGAIQPISGSQIIVCSAGMYFNNKLIRTTDGGATWSIVRDDIRNYLFVGFHPQDPMLCFSDNARSTDAGATWTPVPYLVDNNAQIMGMCREQPDTLYALGSPRNKMYRSDDRGVTWRLYASVSWSFNRLDSKPTFAVHPTDPNVVYTLNSSGDLARFDGTTWTGLGVLAAAGGSAPHNNYVRMVAIDPRHPEIIYASMAAPGRAHIFRSTDAGQTWTDISRNLSRCGGLGIYVHPHTGELMVGSAFGTWFMPPPYDSPQAIYHQLVFNLHISQWLAVANHGAAGVFDVPLVEGYVEPRTAGLRQVRVRLSDDADPASLPTGGVTIAARPLVDGHGQGAWHDVSALVEEVLWQAGNTEILINLNEPMPDGHECRISLSAEISSVSGWPLLGSSSVTLRVLAGDVDGSGVVDSADILAVRERVGEELTAATSRYDVDGSGAVTGADLRAVRSRLAVPQ